MAEKATVYETLKLLFYSGKVKPSLNKIIAELEKDPSNLELTLLACKALLRGKEYKSIEKYADAAIKIDDQNPTGYHYKGLAIHHNKGQEQEALKNINKALEIDPENVVFLKDKAITHLALYKDYDLPVKFAEKHGDKSRECILKIIDLVDSKAAPNYMELYAVAEASMMIEKNLDAKQYLLKAEKAFNKAEEGDKNQNVYKDIIKAQKACQRLIDKFTE